jgi:hypothetical protein
MSFSSNKGLPKFVFGRIILNKFTRIPSPRTPVYYLPRPYIPIKIPMLNLGEVSRSDGGGRVVQCEKLVWSWRLT